VEKMVMTVESAILYSMSFPLRIPMIVRLFSCVEWFYTFQAICVSVCPGRMGATISGKLQLTQKMYWKLTRSCRFCPGAIWKVKPDEIFRL
jgi:hypothetical protein